MIKTFEININKVYWINEEDNPHDRCAHADFEVFIENEIFIKNGYCNLSASALHLMRTLDRNHTKENPVGEVLIPSTEGHDWSHHPDSEIIHITTMSYGENWWVKHEGDIVEIELESEKKIEVSQLVYQNEIKKLIEAVELIFNESEPRLPATEKYDREANFKFWREWKKLRSEYYPNLPTLSETINNYTQQ